MIKTQLTLIHLRQILDDCPAFNIAAKEWRQFGSVYLSVLEVQASSFGLKPIEYVCTLTPHKRATI